MCSLSQKYPLCKCNVFTNHLSSGGAEVKNPPASAGDTRDTGLFPGSGRSPRGGNGNPLQYSCLENSMGRGTWWATVHGGLKEWDMT